MAQPAPYSNVPSKDDIASNRKLALALAGKATDTSPVGHWTQALARAVQGGVGGMHQSAASEGEKSRQDALVQALQSSGTFGGLNAGDQAIMAQNPEVMQSVAAKSIGNRLDPNAGTQRETANLRLQAMREELAMNREMAPLKRKQMEATIRQLEQKDVLNSAIADMLKPPQGAPPAQGMQPQGGIQPQSFEGQPQNADPMLVQTQAAEAQGMPAQPPAQPDLVDTPMGKMTLDDARRRGFALALAGKGDAGKLLTDAANTDKLGKTAQGEVEKDIVGLTNTIGRLDSISKRFDPKFLQIPERAGMAWAGLQDKFGSLKPETKAELGRYTKFRQGAVQNAALYVKYLSGVAVAEAEFNRIMKTLPNAGTGIFDGDSPTEFKAKMDETITQSKMAMARAKYLRTQGFRGKPWEAGIALDDMGDIIRQRGAELQQQLQGRLPPERMQTTVRQKLKQEFGI